jgi:hypothetical protein|tara:strand:- start:59 stop:742 length:684 start_codon:yes stop_codon:yes gene_type:complete
MKSSEALAKVFCPEEGLQLIELGSKDSPSFVGACYLDDISVCDDLIFNFDNQESEKGVKEVGTICRKNKIIVDKKTKDSTDMSLNPSCNSTKRYGLALQKILKQYWVKYPDSNNVGSYHLSHMNMQKYNCGGGFHKWHSERTNFAKIARHLVYMTYLNDVTDGGETEFLYQKLKVKARRGLTLIWPVDWTHTHRGLPSATQEKYIVTGWYEYTSPHPTPTPTFERAS